MSAPAVFLDRDGVLTMPVVAGAHERPPWTLDELEMVPGSIDALVRLRRAGYRLVVVTNQPDVSRGDVSAMAIAAINDEVARVLSVDAVYSCLHDTADRCDCRKPRPGMLQQAAREMDLDLARSWTVGDRWVDLAAGHGAGTRTVLIEHARSWGATSAGPPPVDLQADVVVTTLAAAVDAILVEDTRRQSTGRRPTG